jgi:hypothetical protein
MGNVKVINSSNKTVKLIVHWGLSLIKSVTLQPYGAMNFAVESVQYDFTARWGHDADGWNSTDCQAYCGPGKATLIRIYEGNGSVYAECLEEGDWTRHVQAICNIAGAACGAAKML